MKTPIEMLLDQVEWKPIEGPLIGDDNLPAATHEGVLHIGRHQLKCYQLDDGRTVIDAECLENFFKFMGM